MTAGSGCQLDKSINVASISPPPIGGVDTLDIWADISNIQRTVVWTLWTLHQPPNDTRRSMGSAVKYFSVSGWAVNPVQNVINHHLGDPGGIVDRHVAARLAPPGSRGSGHPKHVHGVLKL